MTDEIKSVPGATVFAGPQAVEVYRATALASGLRLYDKTGMRPNTRWTPTNMLRTAESITGKKYKRGQYEQAAADLTTWARDEATRINIATAQESAAQHIGRHAKRPDCTKACLND